MSDMIDQIRADREAGTPGPWILCAHLADAETDKNCRCGYRGVIYGPGAEAMAICQPGHESPPVGEEYTEPQRYARSAELANSRRIARVPDLEAAYIASVARIAELEAENKRLRWMAYQPGSTHVDRCDCIQCVPF